MDPVTSFIRSWKLPVRPWGKSLFDFIVPSFQRLFDALGADSTDGTAYSMFPATYIPGALARRELRQMGMEEMLCGE